MIRLVIFLSILFFELNSFEIIIKNVAKATYKVDDQERVSFSNEVKSVYKKVQNPNYKFKLFKYSFKNQQYIDITDNFYITNDLSNKEFFNAVLKFANTKIDPTKIVPLLKTKIQSKKDPIIILFQDKRANKIPTKQESLKIVIDNNQFDKEVVKLHEIKKNSSIFIGYILPTYDINKMDLVDNNLYVYNGAKITLTPRLFYLEDKKRSTRAFDIKLLKSSYKNLDADQKMVWISNQTQTSKIEIGSYSKFDIKIKNLNDNNIGDFKVFIQLPKSLKYVSSNFLKSLNISFDDTSLNQNLLVFDIKDFNEDNLEFSYILLSDMEFNSNNKIDVWCMQDEKLISNIDTKEILIKNSFLKDRGFIFGKFDLNSSKSLENIRIYLDTGEYAITDRYGRFHFAGLKNRSYVIQIDQDSLKDFDLISCSDNLKQKADLSKFVDLKYTKVKRVKFCLKERKKSKKKAKKFIKRAKKSPKMPNYTKDELNKIDKSKFLWPKKNFNPPISSIKVAIAHKKDEKLRLFINDREVNILNFDKEISSKDSKFKISIYTGVDLEEGLNLLKAKFYSKNGKLLDTLEQKVHLSSSPVRAEIVKEHSYLVADGENPIVIAVRLYDVFGYPVAEDVQGVFHLQEPYYVQSTLNKLKNNPFLKKVNEDRYIVYGDGIAYIYIAPTTKAQEAKLRFKFANKEQLLRVWIKPKPRKEWILVGFLEGSVGYRVLKDNLEKIDSKDKIYSNLMGSFFAKGKIKGNFLLTIAYDSTKDKKNVDLFHKVDPNEYYMIYQDNSLNGYDAQSQRKLYLKIEKKQFYALFGDINTDLEVNKLSKYSRSFNGFKSEYNGDRFLYNIFVSDSKNIFVKDEIKADGTSGAYNLRYKDILINSERVFIEVRDRNHPNIVIQKTPMRRFFDYSIDYTNATIYFKEPIFSTDFNLNPKYIVIDYEIKSNSISNLLYGGRVGAKFYDGRVETGISYIKEDLNLNQKTLKAIDTKINIFKNLQFNAEYAKTKHLIDAKDIFGDAYLFEVNYYSNRLKATSYFRRQNDSFGLKQENQLYKNSQKIGFDAKINYFKRVGILVDAYRDKELLNDTKEDSASLSLEYKKYNFASIFGYRYSLYDKKSDGRFLTTIKNRFFNNKLSLNLSQEYSPKSYKKGEFQIKYAFNSLIDIFLLNSINNEDQKRVINNIIGFESTIFDQTDVKVSMIRANIDNQNALFNRFGISKRYPLSDNITISGGIEQQIKLEGEGEEFRVYTTSINFNKKPWSSSIQLQLRDSKEQKKGIFDFGLYKEINFATALATQSRYTYLKKEKKSTFYQFYTNFSTVHRSLFNWLILNRLDFNYLVDLNQKNSILVNSILINKELSNRFEYSLSYGLKYTKQMISSKNFDNVMDLLHLSSIFKLTSKYDLLFHFGSLKNYDTNKAFFTYGIEVGYRAMSDLFFGLGYNFEGFKDSDFKIQNYTTKGLYFRVGAKFNQMSLKEILKRG